MARKRGVLFHRLHALLEIFGPGRLPSFPGKGAGVKESWGATAAGGVNVCRRGGGGGKFRIPRLGRGWKRLIIGGCVWLLVLGTSPIWPLPVFSQVSQNTSPESWFQQGQLAYEAANYSQAARALDRALAGFQDQGASLKQAITLGNQSLVYQALGQWTTAQAALEASLTLLQVDPASLTTAGFIPDLPLSHLQVLPSVLTIEGQLWLQQGQPDAALTRWQQAERLYAHLANPQGILTSQMNQVQALQALGLYLQARELASAWEDQWTQIADPPLRIRALRSLGDTYRAVGQLRLSQDVLLQGMAEIERWEGTSTLSPTEKSALLLSLGHTYQAIGQREQERRVSVNRQGKLPWDCRPLLPVPTVVSDPYEAAQASYQQAAHQTASVPIQVSARLGQLKTLLATGDGGTTTQQLWAQTQAQLLQWPVSRSQVYGHIQLAQQGACLKQLAGDETLPWGSLVNLLKQGVATAEQLQDPVAIAEARGNLGGLYEYFGRQAEPISQPEAATWRAAAIQLTEQALTATQPAQFPDIAYQWQWQLARLTRSQGNAAGAIEHYRQAVKTLQTVRNDLLTIDAEVQFSFRDNVEPVYRELIDLLLQDEQPTQAALVEVIDLIDNIQLAELESFLRCNLAGTVELTQAELPTTSAIIYTVMLTDRLEVIYQLPGEAVLHHHRVFQPQETVEATLNVLRQELERNFLTEEGEVAAREVYRWLIAPQLSILEQHGTDTLVFVLDGTLRSVPMAALQNDQGQVLLDQFAVALTPRLQLQRPQPLSSQDLDTLFFGLSQTAEDFLPRFPPLPFVEAEAEYTQRYLPSQVILNDGFTKARLTEMLQANPAAIVHFATHGEFSSDPEQTFILAWDTPITSSELNQILRNTPFDAAIELLVLSACKTAEGDNRATLGIAGIALQAGAQSTLASLWTVNDETTSTFVEYFYQALTDPNQTHSRAQALRAAQLKMKADYGLPRYWAPYILVGNWL